MNKLSILIGLLISLSLTSCSESSNIKAKNATDEVGDLTLNQRSLRNAPQFLALVSKTLNLNPHDVSTASNYNSLKSKMPIDSNLSESNPNDSAFIAASKISYSACSLYINDNENSDIKEFLEKIAQNITFDGNQITKLTTSALSIIKDTDLDQSTDENDIKKAKIITCTYILVTKLLF